MADKNLPPRRFVRPGEGTGPVTANALNDMPDAGAPRMLPWQESQAIRPPPSVAARIGQPEAFPLGAYDPNARQFAAPEGMLGLRERAAAAAFASQPESGVEYSDYDGAGGWGYRLYDDGSIKVIKAPEGHKAGAKLSGGAAYDAIWREIGSKPPSFSTPNGPKAGGLHEAQPVAPDVPTVAGDPTATGPLASAGPSTEQARQDIAPGADLLRRLRGVG